MKSEQHEEIELKKAVDQAVQAVATWRTNVVQISAQIDGAHQDIAAANELREQHALAATLNDPTAVAHLKKARAAHAEATQSLHDLEIALEGARAREAEAAKSELSARRAMNQHLAGIAIRKRIVIGSKLDAVSAEMTNLQAEYVNLGNEIINLDVLPRSYAGVADHESAMGARRVRAAMPKFMWKLFPGAVNDEAKSEPLEITEARYFGLHVKVVGETVVDFVRPKAANS